MTHGVYIINDLLKHGLSFFQKQLALIVAVRKKSSSATLGKYRSKHNSYNALHAFCPS